MILEELSFMSKGFFDCLSRVNISLSSVDDRNVSEPQRDDATGKNIDNICTCVHQVDFGENADRSAS